MKKFLSVGLAAALVLSMVHSLSGVVLAAEGQAVSMQSFDAAAENTSYKDSMFWGVENGVDVSLDNGACALQASGDTFKVKTSFTVRYAAYASDSMTNLNKETASKSAIMFHVTVPEVPASERRTDIVDQEGNACFGFAPIIRTSDGGWFYIFSSTNQDDSEFVANRFEKRASLVTANGTAEKATTNGQYVLLPYGFDGWVKIETADLRKVWGKDTDRINMGDLIDCFALDLTQVYKGYPILLGDMSAVNEGDTLIGLTGKVPGVPVDHDGLLIADFDSNGSVGDNLAGNENAQSFWGVDGASGNVIVTVSDQKAVSGNSCAVSVKDAEDDGTYSPSAVLKVNDPAGVGEKQYILFHVAIPEDPDGFFEEFYARNYSLSLTMKTADAEDKTQYFAIDGGTNGDKIELLKDGGSKWVRGITNGYHAEIPYGFTGWVRFNMDDFILMYSDTKISMDKTALRDNFDIALSNVSNALGKVYIDSVYAADSIDKVPGLTFTEGGNDTIGYNKAETNAAGMIQDFETAGKVGTDLNYETNKNSQILWAVENTPLVGSVSTVISDEQVANGKHSCKVFANNEDYPLILEANVVGNFNDSALNAVKGKRYIALHISVPGMPSSKSDTYVGLDGTKYFGISLGLRSKLSDGKNGYWRNNGGFFSNQAELFKDGGSKWVDALTKKDMVYLPYGFSGWIKLDTQNFQLQDSISIEQLDLSTLLSVWDLTLSQITAEPLYLDAIYALNEGDILPGLIVTENGDNEIGYPKEDQDQPQNPDTPNDEADDNTQTENKDNDLPQTGDRTVLPVLALLSMASFACLIGRKRRGYNE
ncbi:MAG: LPXTG cell wall anchor domain-containing protein [Clostridiales bacterium]|nr:LPXTG cell wall anchor domain-containing protein [Clostridiales bacterium]